MQIGIISMIKSGVKKLLNSILWITIFATLLNAVSWQFKLISGGMPGYGLVLNYLFGWPVGLSLWWINLFLIALLLLISGKGVGIRSLVGMSYFSLAVDVSKNVLNLSQQNLSLPGELLMLFGFGLVSGVAIWQVLRNGYAIGGYSVMVQIMRKFLPKISNQLIMLGLDILLIMISIGWFGWKYAVYILADSVAFYLGMELMDRINMN